MDLNQRISTACKSFDGGQSRLGEIINKHRNTITGWVKGKTEPKLSDLDAIAKVTGVDLHWLRTGEGEMFPNGQETVQEAVQDTVTHDDDDNPVQNTAVNSAYFINETLPILGHALGSLGTKKALANDLTKLVHCPLGLKYVRGAYALYVRGNSMTPRYESGDIIFIDPHKPYRVGDIIVIQEQLYEDTKIETYVKKFVDETEDEIHLSQYRENTQKTCDKNHSQGAHNQ